MSYFRKFLHNNRKWEELLPALTLSYNTAPLATIGLSPFFLAYNRRPVLPFDLGLPRTNYSMMETDQMYENIRKVHSHVQTLHAEGFLRMKQNHDRFSQTK